MFFWVFFIVSIICMAILIFLNGLAEHMASGPPPTPTNWWLMTGISVGCGLVFALIVQGLASFF